MNRKEVMQILSVLKAAYPHSFKDMTKLDGEALVNLWARQFAEEDPEAVSAAVNALISTRTAGYSPTVGEIKDQLHRLRTLNGLSDADAWNLVEKACRRGLYNAREEYAKLPVDVQAAVGGPEQLKAWAMMDSDTVNSVVASNFRKSYRTVQERAKEKALIPPEVRAFVTSVAEQMKLGSSGDGFKREILGEPPKPAALPASLKPMAYQPKQEPVELKRYEPIQYEPLPEDEWERRRAEMLRKLAEHQGGEPNADDHAMHEVPEPPRR